ncbi:hypothetical protein CFC21_009265 [Triticum aestivum]|uniref:Uncharacterized protein n=2 Tax=Triticum aestivum TaxID=4565 RepID=A0A3B5Z5D3_WHEAT|nr:hypothetical protein CFC21_009265 [Triticum aestivum]
MGSHLFLSCPVARVAWRSIGVVLGTDLCPNNAWQYYVWCNMFLPNGTKFFTVGLTAVTWAIWLVRNRATFEKKLIKSPFEFVFSACSFLLYWPGLQNKEDAEELRQGAEMIRSSTTRLMAMCEKTRRAMDDDGEVLTW